MLDLNAMPQVIHGIPACGYAGIMQTMGDRIRMLRNAKGMTQTELGDLCGVGKSAVSAWEKGEVNDIKLKAFLSLVSALGTKYEYLVFGDAHASVSKKRSPGTLPLSENPPKGRFPS